MRIEVDDINTMMELVRQLEKIKKGKRSKHPTEGMRGKIGAMWGIWRGQLNWKSYACLSHQLLGFSHDPRFAATLAGLASTVFKAHGDEWPKEDAEIMKKILSGTLSTSQTTDLLAKMMEDSQRGFKGKRTKSGLSVINGGRNGR